VKNFVFAEKAEISSQTTCCEKVTETTSKAENVSVILKEEKQS
jgi:hypothetical protein